MGSTFQVNYCLFIFLIRCQSRSANTPAPQSPGHLRCGHLQNPRRPSSRRLVQVPWRRLRCIPQALHQGVESDHEPLWSRCPAVNPGPCRDHLPRDRSLQAAGIRCVRSCLLTSRPIIKAPLTAFCFFSLDKPAESADRLLQERFRKLGLFPEAFSSIQYRGTRTYNPPTDFSGLLRSLEQQLDNNTTRSPRSASVIYKALQVVTCNKINQRACYGFFLDLVQWLQRKQVS